MTFWSMVVTADEIEANRAECLLTITTAKCIVSFAPVITSCSLGYSGGDTAALRSQLGVRGMGTRYGMLERTVFK